MQTIVFKKNYRNFKEGDITQVGNNEAHSLIDGGFARLYQYENKMMTTKRRSKWSRMP